MESIAAFVDGSFYGASVCDHAAWAAERLRVPVTLVHALGRPDASSAPADLSGNLKLGARRALLEKLAAHDAERATLAQERGRALLDDARARMIATADVEVRTRLRLGDPVQALEEIEREAGVRLLVIGKRGEDASSAMEHLGSNLDRLVRAADRPALITSRAFRPVGRVLLAFDGGASARRAVERIAESPMLRGAAIDVLTAGSGAAEALAAAAGRLREAGFETAEHRLEGPPDPAIATAVRDLGADMLVLGKSGHSRLHQFFVGSTTLALMRSCQVPVLIFP
ncbi:MAG: universal stress protein [Paracoccaceae bacterium]